MKRIHRKNLSPRNNLLLILELENVYTAVIWCIVNEHLNLIFDIAVVGLVAEDRVNTICK